MKKNLILAAVVAVAAIFASCESKEPTAVLPENMNDSVIVTGYVRYTTLDDKGAVTSPKLVDEGTEVQVLYGTTVGGSIVYTPYTTKVNDEGFYKITLGCAAGKAIDEIKVECSMFMEYSTYAKYTDSEGHSEWKKTDAYFYGSISEKNLAAHNAYGLDVTLAPVDNTSKPGMN